MRSQVRTSESIAEAVDLLYRSGESNWDIGGSQQVVKQLCALGVVRGDVLDPGCGVGYHTIHYVLNGCRAVGVDASPTAIAYARANAREAGVAVDFVRGDATELRGFENRFDTVVDSAFFQTFTNDPGIRLRYAQALHRVTKPGARLFVFGCAPGHVNGFTNSMALHEDDFLVLRDSSFVITYLGKTTYELRVSSRKFERAHVPMWELHAERTN